MFQVEKPSLSWHPNFGFPVAHIAGGANRPSVDTGGLLRPLCLTTVEIKRLIDVIDDSRERAIFLLVNRHGLQKA